MGDMRSMTGDVGQQVAAKLAELQGSRTDSEMAELLGCSRPYFWQVKNGQRRISYAMAKRAAGLFPEIGAIIARDVLAAGGAVA